MVEKLEFLSAILIVSRDAKRLAEFYRDKLGVPLEDERHDDTPHPHWGCQLGDLHFAIHPIEDFPEDTQAGVGAIKLAFTVFDMESFAAGLQERGVELVYPPRDLGWSKMTAVRDPDGNYIEFTELADSVYQGYEERRGQGFDLIARWRQSRAGKGR